MNSADKTKINKELETTADNNEFENCGSQTYRDRRHIPNRNDIETIEAFIKEVEKYNDLFDGKVLALVLKLFFYSGFKKGDIKSLSFDNVIENAIYELPIIKDEITIGKNKGRTIVGPLKQDLLEYIKEMHLKNDKEPLSDYLFPRYKHEKQIDRDLERFFPNHNYKTIRRVGIHRYISMQMEEGVSKENAYKNTYKLFNIRKRATDDLLKGLASYSKESISRTNFGDFIEKFTEVDSPDFKSRGIEDLINFIKSTFTDIDKINFDRKKYVMLDGKKFTNQKMKQYFFEKIISVYYGLYHPALGISKNFDIERSGNHSFESDSDYDKKLSIYKNKFFQHLCKEDRNFIENSMLCQND